VTDKPPRDGNSEDLILVHVKSIWGMAHLIAIPQTRSFYVNPKINLKIFNSFYSHAAYTAPLDLPARYFNNSEEDGSSSDGELQNDDDPDFVDEQWLLAIGISRYLVLR